MERVRGGGSPAARSLAAAIALVLAASARAQSGASGGGTPEGDSGARVQVYGFAMLDAIYDFRQEDPNWFDMVRPSKLPAFANQFGEDGNFWASVRPSRLGVRSWLPTGLGEIRTEFEFDLLGVGSDAGQTTFHLRHAWGELGPVLAGQTYSVFMDSDVFPNALEFWGPSGMVFYRNVQVRWTPIRQDDDRLALALERPGATGDSGEVADRVELQHIDDRFPYPDFTAQYRHSGDWGHVQLSGLVRYIGWKDTVPGAIDLSGHAIGWGLNLGSVLQLSKKSTARLEVTYGRGIATYMRDAPTDVGAESNADPHRPVVGKTLPIFGMVAFYERQWNERFRSAIGYSRLDVENSRAQLPSAFRAGQYALADLLYYPVKDVMTGLELQWGRRRNFSDGFAVDDYRLQFSAKYSFSFDLGAKKK